MQSPKHSNKLTCIFYFFHKNVHRQVSISNRNLKNVFSNFIPNKLVTAPVIKPTTTQFINKHSTISPNWPKTSQRASFVYELSGYGFKSGCSHLNFRFCACFNPFSTNFTKWSNTFKQFVSNLLTNCLSVFGNFVGLALKGLSKEFLEIQATVVWIHSEMDVT